MSNRFNTHRGELMRTPFWGEGWALYWELLLWDTDFPRDDADRIGMLFWRLHRAARIIFSLQFQLGEWAPQQAVDFLVDRVGHERANAEVVSHSRATTGRSGGSQGKAGSYQLSAIGCRPLAWDVRPAT